MRPYYMSPAASPKRLWAFRFLAAVALPCLLLLLAEVGARNLTAYPPATFFIEQEIDGGTWVLDNPSYGTTFFHPQQARDPAQNRFARRKPAGTTRILVLGESAAMGFPRPEFGLANVLQGVLQDAAPDRAFDVIDGTMTMINSHFLLEIGREAMAYEPDAVVVYAGNNEVIGPYGPASVFGRFHASTRRVRLERWLHTHSRLVRWLTDRWTARRWKDGAAWRGLDHFAGRPIAADDPRLASMRQVFRANLTALLGEARRRNLPVFLADPAVNLKDWPPLFSAEPAGLDEAGLAAWRADLGRARESLAAKAWSEALVSWQALEARAPAHAETAFALGRCREGLGDPTAARILDERACELDGYRFRADRHISDIVRSVAEEAGEGVRRVEARDRIYAWDRPGEPPLLEHVHLSVSGMYAVADLFARALLEALPAAPGAARREPDRQRVLNSLFLQPDIEEDAWSAVGQFLKMDVFRGQPGYAGRLQDVNRRRDEARGRAEAVSAEDLKAAYEAATAGPEWRRDLLYGRYLLRRGQFEAAVPALARAARAKSNHAEIHELLGNALTRMADYDGAIRALEEAVRIQPYRADAWNLLGLAWYLRGSRERAQSAYERCLSLDPRHAAALNNRGYLDYERGRYESAVERFRDALAEEPGMIEPRYHLGLSLLALGRLDEAAVDLEETVKQSPALGKAWNAWGVILMQQGQSAEAMAKFEEALRAQPDLMEARINLGYGWLKNGEPARAEEVLKPVLAARPDSAEAHHLYGLALARSGRLDDALPHLQRAIQGAAHRSDWMVETARLLLEHKDSRPELVADARELAERALAVSRNSDTNAAALLDEIADRETAP